MEKLDDWVGELLASAQRACNIFSNPVIRPTESGHEVYFQLSEAIQPKVLAPFRSYVRRYCSKQGWQVTAFKATNRFVHFELKVKPEKADRKPRLSPDQYRVRQRTGE